MIKKSKRESKIKKIKVLLFDDDPFLSAPKLATLPKITLISSTNHEFEEMMEMAVHSSFDIILMDGDLDWWGNVHGMRWGADVVRRLRGSGIKTRIVMFSSSDRYNQMGVEAGADAVWGKDELLRQGWKEDFLRIATAKS